MVQIYQNFDWIIINVGLSTLAVLFGSAWSMAKRPLLKFVWFILWILFLPNTLYLISDIQYLPEQVAGQRWPVMLLLAIQFMVVVGLGILTFLLALYPLEGYLKKKYPKEPLNHRLIIVLAINFLVGFAIVLGKIQRTNSWYVFTHPQRVFDDSLMVFDSPMLLLAVLGFGVLANLIYFNFRKYLPIFQKLR